MSLFSSIRWDIFLFAAANQLYVYVQFITTLEIALLNLEGLYAFMHDMNHRTC